MLQDFRSRLLVERRERPDVHLEPPRLPPVRPCARDATVQQYDRRKPPGLLVDESVVGLVHQVRPVAMAKEERIEARQQSNGSSLDVDRLELRQIFPKEEVAAPVDFRLDEIVREASEDLSNSAKT